MHGVKAAPSRLHSNDPDSSDVKTNVALVDFVFGGGPLSTSVRGGVVSPG